MNGRSRRGLGLAAALGFAAALLGAPAPLERSLHARQSGGAAPHDGSETFAGAERAEWEAIRAAIAAITPRTAPEGLAALEARVGAFDAAIAERFPVLAGHLHHSFGVALYRLSRFDMALGEAGKAEKLLASKSDETCTANAAVLVSGALMNLGRHSESAASLERARAAAVRAGNKRLEVTIQVNRSVVLGNEGLSAEAASVAESAVAVARSMGDKLLVAQAVFNRAATLIKRGRAEEALLDLDEAGEIYREAGNEERLRVIDELRADALNACGRYVDALRLLNGQLEAFEEAGDDAGVARALSKRGLTWDDLGRQEQSAADHRRAAGVFESRSMRQLAAREYERLAATLNNAGRNAEALAACDRAEAALGEGSSFIAGSVLEHRAIALFALDRVDEALEALERAGEAFEKIGDVNRRAFVVGRRGAWLASRGRVVEGLAVIDSVADVLANSGHPGWVAQFAAWRSATLLAAGRPREALEEAERGRNVIRRIYEIGVRPLGERSSISFRGEWSGLARRAIECLAALPRDERAAALPAAYAVFESFNGVALAEAVAAPGGGLATTIPDDLADEWQESERRLAEIRAERASLARAVAPAGTLRDASRREADLARLEGELRSAEDGRLALVEKIRARAPAAAPGAAAAASATLDEVRAALPPGTALFEFDAGSERTLAFVITASAAAVADLGPTRPIEAAANRLYEFSRNPRASPAEARPSLVELGRLVLGPCLAALPKGESVERILVAASGELCRVPFEALLVSDAPPSAPVSEWPFLVARRGVAYVHSGTALRDAARRPARTSGPGRLVALAHPAYDAAAPESESPLRGAMESLPATAEEALAIARLFASEAEMARLDDASSAAARDAIPKEGLEVAGERFRVLLRGAARESALKSRPELRDATVLHVACHGHADTESPALCHVALASEAGTKGPKSEDGLLFLSELSDLGVTADLVALSACETNAGGLMPFEGIGGLSRAALAGGAGSVLSTLWRVRDTAARDLVVGFYRAWLEDGLPRIDALARAKREAIRRGAPIGTWAAYTLWDAGR